MKTISNNETKTIKAQMKSIREILKSVEEDDMVLDNASNNYTYDNAMGRNRERFYDLMRQINGMAETAANLYNHYTTGSEKWMTAQATYQVETI